MPRFCKNDTPEVPLGTHIFPEACVMGVGGDTCSLSFGVSFLVTVNSSDVGKMKMEILIKDVLQ